jgi:hypothetical protein
LPVFCSQGIMKALENSRQNMNNKPIALTNEELKRSQPSKLSGKCGALKVPKRCWRSCSKDPQIDGVKFNLYTPSAPSMTLVPFAVIRPTASTMPS